MERNFKELRAKMSPDSLAQSKSRADEILRDKNPTWKISVGEILSEEFLKPRGMTKTELAVSTGLSESQINDIVGAKQLVTADIADRFGRIFNTSAQFWLNLQAEYTRSKL